MNREINESNIDIGLPRVLGRAALLELFAKLLILLTLFVEHLLQTAFHRR